MNLETVTDLADLLPPQGKRHYLLLRDASADSAAITHGLASRLIEENQRRQAVSMRLAQIRGKRVDDDHPEMIAQTRALADADAEIARINERVATHNMVAGPRAELLRNIDTWLRATAANHAFADIEPEPVKLLKGEQIPAGIDRHRRRLRELDADALRINSAPFPSSYAKSIAAAHINKLADAATPIVTNLIEHGGGLIVDGVMVEPPIVFATKMVKAEVDTATGRGIAIGEHVDTVGLLAWLFKDQMLARIGEAIDAEAEDKIALSHEQRAEQLATIASDRQAVEFDETQLLWAGFGTTEARADMTPTAYLLVKPVTKAARPGRELTDDIVRQRRAHGVEGVAFTPADISIPGRAAS